MVLALELCVVIALSKVSVMWRLFELLQSVYCNEIFIGFLMLVKLSSSLILPFPYSGYSKPNIQVFEGFFIVKF